MLLAEIERIAGQPPQVSFEATRPGDQRYFVADTSRLEALTGWRATVPWREGVAALWQLAGTAPRGHLGPRRTQGEGSGMRVALVNPALEL